MKIAYAFAAAALLAGCDITFGADGPVVTPSDSVVGQLVPVGNRTARAEAQTAPVAGQPAAANGESDTPRRTFTLSNISIGAVRPIGVSDNDVEQFKAAVAGEGCTISTVAQRRTIQSQTGFDFDTQESIRDYLWRSGELDRNSGNYQLNSGPCGNA